MACLTMPMELLHVVGDEVRVEADSERVLGELGSDEPVDELEEAEHPEPQQDAGEERAAGGTTTADDEERHPPHPRQLLDRRPELASVGAASAGDGRSGGAGGVDGVAQDLEEDCPGKEERDARCVPLGRRGDGVGHEREEESGCGPHEEAECRMTRVVAVGAQHNQDWEQDNAGDGRHLHEQQIHEAGGHGGG